MHMRKLLLCFVTWIQIILINGFVMRDNNLDAYVLAAKSECYSSKRIASCFKYRGARYIWSFATGRLELFEMDNNTNMDNCWSFVQIADPEKDIIFTDSRQLTSDNEIIRAWKFIKRSFGAFIVSHGVSIKIGSDSTARVIDEDENTESYGVSVSRRKTNKRKKWRFIFPLAILLKLGHLKLFLLPIIFGISIIKLLLIFGGALLIHFFRSTKMYVVQPQVIHSHSHPVPEPVPEISFSSLYGSIPYDGLRNPSNTLNRDWAINRAYSAYDYLTGVNDETM